MIVIVTGILRPAVNDCSSLPAAGTFSTQIFFPLYTPHSWVFCLWGRWVDLRMIKCIISLLLSLVVGCSKPINDDTLIDKDGIKYHPETKELYSGEITISWLEQKKGIEGSYKNGKKDGLWTIWYTNGRKWSENAYREGELYGLSTNWDRKRKMDSQSIYKDGELISQKCWDEDGNEYECSDWGRGCK